MNRTYKLILLSALLISSHNIFCVFGTSSRDQAKKLLEQTQTDYHDEIHFRLGWFNDNSRSIVQFKTGHTEKPYYNYVVKINEVIAALRSVLDEFTKSEREQAQQAINRLSEFRNHITRYYGDEFQKEHERRQAADYKRIPGYAIKSLEEKQDELEQDHAQMKREYEKAQTNLSSYNTLCCTLDSLKRHLNSQDQEISSLKEQLRAVQQQLARLQTDFAHHERSVSAHQAPPPPFNPAYNPSAPASNNPPPSFVYPRQ